MRNTLLALAALFSLTVAAQETMNANYDAKLASQLGADDNGMKSYVLCILKTGPNSVTDKTKSAEYSRKHLDNIGEMAQKGQVVVAGPLKQNAQNYRGILIFNVNNSDEALRLLQDDPMITEKILVPEFYNWYGSAALSEYLPIHEKIAKKKP